MYPEGISVASLLSGEACMGVNNEMGLHAAAAAIESWSLAASERKDKCQMYREIKMKRGSLITE